MLRLFDTRSRQAEQVEPTRRGQLRVFSCGPPAYRYAHVGDLRTALLADLIRRAAHRHRLSVLVCRGSNDVGGLAADGQADAVGPRDGEVGNRRTDASQVYADALLADCSALNIRPPDYAPRASESMGLITDMIGELISGGRAYATAEGSVYFDARTFPGYGALSGNQPPATAADPQRRFDADWALWRGDRGGSDREGGELTWAAPWGPGVPSQDIACSAMSRHYLGDVIDIHAGGIDLRFPHHENERAQSDAAAGHEVVGHWAHGELVLFEGTKLPAVADPVLADPVLLGDLAQRGLDPLALRLAFLDHRYRERLDLTWPGLADADRALRGWREQVATWATHPSRPMSAPHVAEIADAFDDDLDTPAAIRVLRDLAATTEAPPGSKFETFAHVDQLFGLDLAREVGRTPTPARPPPGAERLLAERAAARAEQDWASADRLTEELARRGVTVSDTPAGQHWTVERDR
jgi:cysteinyl-tRNA synthetase